jgi:hypothetical protein
MRKRIIIKEWSRAMIRKQRFFRKDFKAFAVSKKCCDWYVNNEEYD